MLPQIQIETMMDVKIKQLLYDWLKLRNIFNSFSELFGPLEI